MGISKVSAGVRSQRYQKAMTSRATAISAISEVELRHKGHGAPLHTNSKRTPHPPPVLSTKD
eukprot:4538632-Amphidinium_carterae.1